MNNTFLPLICLVCSKTSLKHYTLFSIPSFFFFLFLSVIFHWDLLVEWMDMDTICALKSSHYSQKRVLALTLLGVYVLHWCLPQYIDTFVGPWMYRLSVLHLMCKWLINLPQSVKSGCSHFHILSKTGITLSSAFMHTVLWSHCNVNYEAALLEKLVFSQT